MKNATRIDEIDDFLRDGGTVDDLLIEPEPSGKKRQFGRVGMEIDQEEEKTHYEEFRHSW